MEYYWSGRIYVDEEQITPEQYKQFLEHITNMELNLI